MEKIITEDYETKQEQIQHLAAKYSYDQWRVRIFDMQRGSVQLANPPDAFLSDQLKENFQHATLIMQANGFTFTTSETSSVRNGEQLISTPYHAWCKGEQGGYQLDLVYNENPVNDFESLRLLEIMGKPSIHYFPFKDKQTGKPMPTYLVVNPFENCSYRCGPCSRLPFFGRIPNPGDPHVPEEYVRNTLKSIGEIRREYDPEQIKFINIITGSTPSVEGDIEMYKSIIDLYSNAGFSHCEYGVYTPNIEIEEDMRKLRDLGVVFFTVTMEVTSPEARARFYGPKNAKGRLTFDELVDIIDVAEGVFPYVNTNIMLGYEPADVLKRNLDRVIHETTATVNHFIPRIFLRRQVELLHPDARNLEYFVDLSAFMEREVNSEKKSFGAFFEERFGIPKFGVRFRS